MKPFAIIFISILAMVSCHNTQDNGAKQDADKTDTAKQSDARLQNGNYVNSPDDTTGLLTKLYTGGKIVHEASAERKFRVIVSNGDAYFTNMDTIIEIPGDKNSAHLIIFTAFDYMDGQRDESHASQAIYGMALLAKELGGYKVVNFVRNFDTAGGYGEGGELSMKNFGKEEVLQISSADENAGYSSGGESFYSTDSAHLGKCIFSFYSYSSNDRVFEFDSASGTLKSDGEETLSEYEIDERKVVAVQNNNGKWDELELNAKVTRYDSVNHKMKDSVSTEYYQMDENKGIYEKTGK